jgi:ribonucleoside-diphosphate reductase alpha chain
VNRERLPDRRNAEVFDFIHRNRRWTATIGRFPDGRVAELFLDAAKVDPLSELAQDVAIVASIALQSGCPLETLRHALSGRGEGPLSAALALVQESDSRRKIQDE